MSPSNENQESTTPMLSKLGEVSKQELFSVDGVVWSSTAAEAHSVFQRRKQWFEKYHQTRAEEAAKEAAKNTRRKPQD